MYRRMLLLGCSRNAHTMNETPAATALTAIISKSVQTDTHMSRYYFILYLNVCRGPALILLGCK